MQIDGRTELYGLIGNPVGHSLSPLIYNYLFRLYNINARYLAFNIKPQELPGFFDAAKVLNIKGLNITMPHKETAQEFMNSLDKSAESCGSVNTVVYRDGLFTGYNTDGDGFIKALEFAGFFPSGKNAVLMGAGGAAKTVAAALLDRGARVKAFARRRDRVAEILRGDRTNAFELQELAHHCGDCDLLINTTPLGMKGHDSFESLDFVDRLPAEAVVFDLIYNPMKTELLARAEKKGNPILNGIPHLVFQGARAFEIFTGITPRDEEIKSLIRLCQAS